VPGQAVATRLLPANPLRAQTDRSIPGTTSVSNKYPLVLKFWMSSHIIYKTDKKHQKSMNYQSLAGHEFKKVKGKS